MTPRASGFTLIEVLVALVVSGILITILAGSVQEITGASVLLDTRAELAKQGVTLRRVFHRDLQNMTHPGSLSFTEQRLTFETTHSTLMDAPYPVIVKWDFSGNTVTRIEQNPDIEYESVTVIAEDIEQWSLEAFDDKQSRWLNFAILKTVTAENPDAVLDLTALKLEVDFGGSAMNSIERLPYAVLLMQTQS
jgi:general secretion pathway protein J